MRALRKVNETITVKMGVFSKEVGMDPLFRVDILFCAGDWMPLLFERRLFGLTEGVDLDDRCVVTSCRESESRAWAASSVSVSDSSSFSLHRPRRPVFSSSTRLVAIDFN